jgi:hypothetical protein
MPVLRAIKKHEGDKSFDNKMFTPSLEDDFNEHQ